MSPALAAGGDPGEQAASPRRFPKVLCSRLPFHPLVARNLAVEQVNLAVRVRRNVVFVRHQHDGLARPVQILEQPHDFVARRRVEVSGRLVGEQNAREFTSARAIATRWRCPPDSSFGRWSIAIGEADLRQRERGAVAPLLPDMPA